jgi:membrane-bound metal-dependent hydrolase YbcI (DUF457 family)
MMFPTHVVTTAATTAYLLDKWNVTDNKWLYALGFVAGAIPDCDLLYYMAKKKMKNKQFTADAVNHRQTYMHAPLFYLVLLTPLFIVASLFHMTTLYQALVLLSIGVFSHILLDMVWVGGVPLLYPFQRGMYGFFLKHSRRQLQTYIAKHGNDWFGFYMQHPLFYFECCFLTMMMFSKIVPPSIVLGSTLFFAIPAMAIQFRQKRQRDEMARMMHS